MQALRPQFISLASRHQSSSSVCHFSSRSQKVRPSLSDSLALGLAQAYRAHRHLLHRIETEHNIIFTREHRARQHLLHIKLGKKKVRLSPIASNPTSHKKLEKKTSPHARPFTRDLAMNMLGLLNSGPFISRPSWVSPFNSTTPKAIIFIVLIPQSTTSRFHLDSWCSFHFHPSLYSRTYMHKSHPSSTNLTPTHTNECTCTSSIP